MLRFLRIRHLAVIEAVDVEFDVGFNVLTGETGAGKSILVEAVSLLLGARASADLVRTGEAQASIEAVFDVPGRADELVVRREVTSQGRSRCYVDGVLTPVAALRDLRLVEVHGQHEHQALLDPVSHLSYLDLYAGSEALVTAVGAAWETMRAARERLDRSRMDVRERAARLDLVTFQLGEIRAAGLKAGEDDELAAVRLRLANAERLQRLCDESYTALYDGEHAVLAGLASVWKRVGELATLDPEFQVHLESRDGIKSQLEDLSQTLRRYADTIDASPVRLQEVEDRITVVGRLKRKYGPSLDDVLARAEALEIELDLLSGSGEQAEHLEEAHRQAVARYQEQARLLSGLRRSAATRFGSEMESLLAELAMARTRFEVRFNEAELPQERWTDRGIDEAEFFVSPNPGEDVRPMVRIVSGGELSRVMLALKTLAATRTAASRDGAIGTLIFDEVDAGIGGRVADVVGRRLAELGRQFQVLCITHLPQIAARATTQFRIDKHVRAGRTVTAVAVLDESGRVDELARMIAGDAISDQVRGSAREMLRQPAVEAKGKRKAKGESESARGRR
jgi:DNA repair protein RecN (Recombination protein N)